MFNIENSAQKHKTTLLLCPAGEVDKGQGTLRKPEPCLSCQ